MKGHHNVLPTVRRCSYMQYVNDVGMSGQSAHRLFFAEEALEVLLVDRGGEHFDGDCSFEGALKATVDRSKPAPADLDRTIEALGFQLQHEVGGRFPFDIPWIGVGAHTITS